MGLYMIFPVGCFYYFNQAELFEEWMVQMRREMYPPESQMHRKEFEECIRQMRTQQEREALRLLEEKEKSVAH